MKPVFIDVWAWVNQFHYEAERNHDPIRSRFRPLYNEAWHLFERNPETATSLLQQGRMLAQQVNEPLWVTFFDHWLAALWIFCTNETVKGLDLAVKNVVEVSKPEFRNWSFIPRIQIDLIYAYITTDPLSYADYIREGLHLLDTELNFDIDVWRRIPGAYTSLLIIEADVDQALKMSREHLSRSDGDDFRLTYASNELCLLEHYQNHFEAVIQLAQAGEIHARCSGTTKYELIWLQLWQAIGYFKLGDEQNAQRLYQSALTVIQSFGDEFRLYRVPVLAMYHEYLGNLDKALTIRRACLEQAIKSGSFFEEYRARLDVCRLLKIMGSLTDDEIAATRAALSHLNEPARYPPRLDAIIAGDTSEIL